MFGDCEFQIWKTNTPACLCVKLIREQSYEFRHHQGESRKLSSRPNSGEFMAEPGLALLPSSYWRSSSAGFSRLSPTTLLLKYTSYQFWDSVMSCSTDAPTSYLPHSLYSYLLHQAVHFSLSRSRDSGLLPREENIKILLMSSSFYSPIYLWLRW